MKIKFFREEYVWDLMREVEKELADKSEEDIFDIQFCLSANHPAYSTDYNHAIILYK